MTAAASDDMGPVSYQPKEESVSAARRRAEAILMALPGVRGVGEGRDEIGNSAWVAYIVDGSIASTLPDHIEGRHVVYEISGEIDAQAR